MASVYRVDVGLAGRVIRNFLALSQRSRGRSFRLGEFLIIPKVVKVCDSPCACIVLDAFSKYLENVYSVVMFVAGIHREYITQVEVCSDGRIIITPSTDRPWSRVEALLQRLGAPDNV